MSDSTDPRAEQYLQPLFSNPGLIGALLIAGLVLGAHWQLSGLADREARADARAEVEYIPVKLASDAAQPLRVVGAWRLASREPRLGGVSAVALDRGGLLALTDSGVMIRLPKPGRRRGVAVFRDLPAGPGPARFKAGRDSEALARDSNGRGWWVAFENRHSLYLFDAGFARADRKIRLGGLGWRSNKGAEGLLSQPAGVTLFPESGDSMVRVGRDGPVERIALANPFGRLADATMLPDGRIMLLARTFSPAGFTARLLLLDGKTLVPLAALRLGRLGNPEAIAAERLPGGAMRLWVMTDNDYRRRVPTLLIALDWAG